MSRKFVADLDIAVAPFAEVSHRRDLVAALARFNAPSILKTRRLGYDGKGQVSLGRNADAAAAIAALGHRAAILEQRLAFVAETSVLVVRGVSGEMAFYDCPANSHADGILRRSVVPGELEPAMVADAQAMASRIATALDYVGVLAVEMFDMGPGARELGVPTSGR